ncbi:MAG TPA: FtsX-like permease family protein, partial [Wenzhouxiangellaceae bacterium]|nr:FtsX-like permease family protein [Wenzhouxiangellaceae bacterium]
KTLYIRRGDRPEGVATEVIGVVEHQAVQDLREEPIETVYFSSAFSGSIGFFTGMTWTVRTQGDPLAASVPIEQALAGLDADIPLTNVEPLQARVDEATSEMRFSSTLLTLFGLLALLLAVVGLYGVLAYRVRQRLPELGVRLAFGATAGRIFSLVLKQGLLLVGAGLVVGTLLALAMTRGLNDQLVGLSASDPLTYLAIIILFAMVAAVACSVPALRATRADPATTLGSE